MVKAFDLFHVRAKGSAHVAVLIVGLVLALAGGLTEWLSFPLSEPVKGLDVRIQEISLLGNLVAVPFFPGILYLLFLSLSVASLVLRWRVASAPALLLSLLVLLYFPVHVLFGDQQWVPAYVDDSTQRSDLQRFFDTHFLKNKGTEPSMAYIPSYQYLADRAYLVWLMLGWGWMLAFIGTLLLVVQLQRMNWLLSSWVALAFLSVLVLAGLFALVGFSGLRGDIFHHRGDVHLAAGAYRSALNTYAAALRHDRALFRSGPFLLKVSNAHYQRFGEENPYGQVYLAAAEIEQRKFEEAELRLTLLKSTALDGSAFKEAIKDYASRLRVQNYVNRGSLLYTRGEVVEAIRYYQAALAEDPALINARFFLAVALMDLRQYEEGITLLQGLLDDVYHTSVKADFYSTIGDCYQRMGDGMAAREAYSKSYELDNKDNFRALKALAGT